MAIIGIILRVFQNFATLDLVRGDWRSYTNTLQPGVDDIPADDGTLVDVNTVNIEENSGRTPIPYVLPPGVIREQLNNNNTIIRQNEQLIQQFNPTGTFPFVLLLNEEDEVLLKAEGTIDRDEFMASIRKATE